MKDGAHTHHSHGSGSGLLPALTAAVVVAVCSGAIVAAITALIHLLLIVLATIIGMTVAVGLVWALISRQRPLQQDTPLGAQNRLVLSARREHSASEIAAMQAQLDQVTRQLAAIATRPALPSGQAAGTHLHLHGIDPAHALRAVHVIRSGGDDTP